MSFSKAESYKNFGWKSGKNRPEGPVIDIWDKDPLFLWYAFVVGLLFEALIGQKQGKHEREPKEQGIPILDMVC